MSYSKIIDINDGFKTSVNIEFDLHKYNKITSYIPTEDVCEVLSYYFKSFNDSNLNRSTLLEGPYGKGKSHLLLSILQLVSTSENKKEVNTFLEKVNAIDPELYSLIVNARNSHFKLLPVIINSNYTHLTQSLNIALKEALNREKLDNLFPNTAYEVALGVIDKWTVEVEKDLLCKCLEKEGVTIDQLKTGISNYSLEYYEMFINVYNCIARGLDFNPFASDDIVKNYADIAYKIKDFGYSGLFVVFDEFSKFIDNDNPTLSLDLKILQDLSEKASRTGKDGQIHLCCITHKSLNEYYRNKKDVTVNAFRTIEGRFQEIRFNRSLNQNYAIISLSLNKKKGFDDAYIKFYNENQEFVDSIKNYRMFEGVDEDIYLKGCYPLNPLTVYSVIQISEKIAQNERTLFTFLSDSDDNSFSSFLKKGSGLFNINNIYDYFEDVIEKSNIEEVKNIGRKSELCFDKVSNENELNIIKTLAIIKMVDNPQFESNSQTIADCLKLDIKDVQKDLDILENKGLIKKLFSNDSYDFASSNSKIIDDKIEEYDSRTKKIGVSNILNNLFKNQFVLPRKYNTEHKMTRYFNVRYITDFELQNLESFKSLFDGIDADGVVLNVLQSKTSLKEIKEKYNSISYNNKVVLRVSKPNVKILDEIIRLGSLEIVSNEKGLDQATIEETKNLLAIEKYELNKMLNRLFKDSKSIGAYEFRTFNELLSIVMENEFPLAPTINNEMINKNSPVSSQYVKPRNTVVNLYISNEINRISDFSPTGPENTVFNSFDEEDNEKRGVLDLIKNFYRSTEHSKTNAELLINQLKDSPYGIRKGVMPLFIAKAYQEENSNIIFYFESREIDFNAENINKMIDNPSKYYIQFEKTTNERTNYLKSMLSLFDLETSNNFRNDNKIVIKNIQNWVMGLPRIIRNCNDKNNFLGLEEEFINFKKIFNSFDLNEYEVLFISIPKVFGNLKESLEKITEYKNFSSSITKEYETNISNCIKEIYEESSEISLFNAVHDWIIKNKVNERILEDKEQKFIKVFNEDNYNDSYVVNEISKALFKVHITDWDKDRSEEIYNFVRCFKTEINSRKLSSEIELTSSNKETPLSSIGKLVKNNIVDIFDEYNDSVSNEEKAEILSQLLKELL